MQYRIKQERFTSYPNPSTTYTMEYYKEEETEEVVYWVYFTIDMMNVANAEALNTLAKEEANRLHLKKVEDGTMKALSLGLSLETPSIIYDSANQ